MPVENLQPINELYAFMSIDDKGNEGIVGRLTPLGMMPMVFGYADMLLKLLEPQVMKMCKETKKTIRLVKFTGKEVIKTYGVD